MSRASGVLAAMKAVPGGARYTPAPQSGGWGGMNSVAANAMYQNAAYQNGYGPFLPRPSRVFTDGAFGPGSPIQPVPVDEPATPGGFPDPRYWQYPVTWNLPTQPGTEGLKLASFAQLQTIASKYNVARRAIELRKEEIAGLEWEIQLTTKAAKAYQGDHKAMRDFGERAAQATRFFRHPDPDYFDFQSFLKALLEEIFVYDALCLVFRPKYGKGLGRGLLGSDLDSLNLVSGPTVRPLLNMHGGKPRPPAPAYQQFLYGVPRSDFQTVISGADIDDYGLTGAEINQFRADTMLYLPLVPRRESPYGFPPIEQALLPIISGLQKQEFQLDYFTEGSIPGCYISPGDPNMTPTQVRELQDALNGIAGDPAYHLKVIVLPPGSKVEPQRPIDLSDSFDYLVMNQVLMQLDVMPTELGIIPDIGANATGPSASGIKLGAQATRDPKSRKSTKPLLMTLCGIANYVLQDICGQADMEFSFEGLQDDEDKAAITTLGVEQVQNGIASIDEVRDRLDLPPWALQETSEPVVFTAQGPIPFSMAPQLIANMQNAGQGGSQGTNSGQRTASSRSRTSQPSVRQGGQTKPNGSHPAPVAPHREAATPAHSAAAGAIQSPGPRTGGTTSRSSVAGSRKKAVEAELSALARHLRKGRDIATWEPRHIPGVVMATISEDIGKGILIDTAVERAGDICLNADGPGSSTDVRPVLDTYPDDGTVTKAAAHWPGWERDLGLVGAHKNLIGQAFHDAETRGSELRKKAATGSMYVSNSTLRDLISDEVKEVFSNVLTPLWTEAWHLGYAAAKSLVTGQPADFSGKSADSEALRGFIGTEGEHWLSSIARTGLGNNSSRSELIARTEVARAINSAAIQCYRDYGVTHKHLLLSPDACDLCKDAADDGEIPLDAPFSAGGVLGLVHPACVVGSTRVAAPGRGEVVAGQEAHRLTIDAPIADGGVFGDRGLASASAVAVAERDFGRANIRAVSERDYVGDVITILTASGYELTATPNHPIATRGGWVPVSELAVGDHVLSSTGREWAPDGDPDVDDIPPCIEEVAQAFPVAFAPMPTAAEDFHGDGAGSEVYVVRTDRLLVDNVQPAFGEHVSEGDLGRGNIPAATADPLNTEGLSLSRRAAHGPAAPRIVGGAREVGALLGSHAGHAVEHGSATAAALDAGPGQALLDYIPADAEGFCERILALSSEIALDEIVHVQRDFMTTQVFNLETVDGWYIGNGIVTHNCRCAPTPADIEAEPPLADLGKNVEPLAAMTGPDAETERGRSLPEEDKTRAGFLMLRARTPRDGKMRYLLHGRTDETWGLPGGTAHVGEDPHAAAIRESAEEIGTLPPLGEPLAVMQYPDGDRTVWIHLHEVPWFQVDLASATTPEETAGVGWFRRRDFGDLDLHPPFRRQWEAADWKHAGEASKALQRMVNENGEVLTLTPASQALQAVGSRWPYPKRSDGTEWPDAGPGAYPGASPGGEPPHWADDMAEPEPHDTLEPRGGDDGRMPARGRKPAPPAEAFPNQGNAHDEAWPQPQATLTPAASPVGGNTGVPPSSASKNDSGHPVVGSVPAKTPKPMAPHAVAPEAYDPAEAVEDWNPQADSDVVHGKGSGGPSDFTDANPVDPETVYLQMAANFPADSIAWVKRASWVGPIWVPWSRVDTDDKDKWAASHQPEKVREFKRQIQDHSGHVAPSVLVQEPRTNRAFVVDGHHRALARESLGQPVLAYLGNINPKDRQAAWETHSSQLHQGSDPANKGDAETLREYWTHEAHGGPTDFAYADEIAWGTPGDFMRAVRLLKEHAHMTDEQAKGYANLMHHRALGYWPAQHAQMEREGE